MVLLESEQVPAAAEGRGPEQVGSAWVAFLPLWAGQGRDVAWRGEDWRLPNGACCVAVPDRADQALPEVQVVGQRVHHPEEM